MRYVLLFNSLDRASLLISRNIAAACLFEPRAALPFFLSLLQAGQNDLITPRISQESTKDFCECFRLLSLSF